MTAAPRGRVDLGLWARKVVGWDGLMPVFMGAAPALVGALVPGNRGVIEVIGVALPIGAFLLRLRAGARQIASNHCGPTLRGFQLAIFCLGLLPLVLFDTMMVLSEQMPAGGLFTSAEDLLVLAILLLFYLAPMTFAMYPGRSPVEVGLEDPTAFAGSPLDPHDRARS